MNRDQWQSSRLRVEPKEKPTMLLVSMNLNIIVSFLCDVIRQNGKTVQCEIDWLYAFFLKVITKFYLLHSRILD